jgi:hypothetical protein
MPVKKSVAMKFPQVLLIDGEPCGCRFAFTQYATLDAVRPPGFLTVCDAHKRMVAKLREQRADFNRNGTTPLPFAVPGRREAISHAPEPIPGFHAELKRRAAIQTAERAKIFKRLGIKGDPSQALYTVVTDKRGRVTGYKLHRHHAAVSEHMRKFAYTQESVAAELGKKPQKKISR